MNPSFKDALNATILAMVRNGYSDKEIREIVVVALVGAKMEANFGDSDFDEEDDE